MWIDCFKPNNGVTKCPTVSRVVVGLGKGRGRGRGGGRGREGEGERDIGYVY